MIDLDRRLQAWRIVCAETAAELRDLAPPIDRDPYDMKPHLGREVFSRIRQWSTPCPYGEPFRIGSWTFRADSALEWVIAVTELSRGDASSLLACPMPDVAGLIVDLLGTEAQRHLFYSRIADGRTWTFFAMSEPDLGSNATSMETRIEDGQLYGVKRYIGNGARGRIGVVFGRTGPHLLSIRAALVEVPAPGWTAESLDMIGLRGACLAEIRLEGVPVIDLLGDHLTVTRRGLWAAIKVFHNMRIQVAAMAMGTSAGILDHVRAHRPQAPGLSHVQAANEACQDLVWQAAAGLDAGTERGHRSSVVKLLATRQAMRTARWAAKALGPASLLEHPLLEKWTRDVAGFEFMDGTSNIQRLHIARTFLNYPAHTAGAPGQKRMPSPVRDTELPQPQGRMPGGMS
ncbi:acyl-CoA dehydrogenase family protein [Nonomuraea angiospora]|uniref:Alkylation response protein AidB-like acyl-CoA dehydrogenase n=1 Tax=Nonomuraea angiospora TaxID=46172 RepID=A0ABR9LPR2_9ACTN|nr:acyl-CoA dehydrogenase family protein [Nonomuraea angiospora]MBE1582268.1 alkylation response protein AidB-like acyl-CoA dehydrogenase [Nonomuraea angiospora]